MKQLNEWTFLRDGIFYIIGLSIIIVFYLNEEFNWYTGIVLMFYYILYYMSISRNEQLKETCLKLLGITNEDDEFNSDYYENQKKRRYSLTKISTDNIKSN